MDRPVAIASFFCAAIVLFLAPIWMHADEVNMLNGERYLGEVLSLDTNTLVLRSDVLGKVRLPRGKIAFVTFGSLAATNVARVVPPRVAAPLPAASSAALTNATTDLAASLRGLGANTNFIQQVQAQFLADAGPQANQKFNEMVAGMMSGKITVNDIRTEAKSAADQLRELKRDLGDDAGGALDGYLFILEHFLQETAPSGVSATNTSRPVPKVAPSSAHASE